ncbi:hypothetical protein F0L74_20575 [Chitinophaga agrisoli]|uniref:Uncharacterized protein n=1 Tax=Chitinophaga agrisoli TaxID=2607653 RepID=A0A5B2VK11_9BACT|nr:hypothetical protein [Chitinophaga agrisoli]KAA2238622.1 hypothetical protein F0L74_20575 [Chitinophaga agrisoli]
MKKDILSFLEKLKENKDGTISGGFGSIRGGFTLSRFGTNNNNCINTGTCSGSNSGGCTNGTCSGSNSPIEACTNFSCS